MKALRIDLTVRGPLAYLARLCSHWGGELIMLSYEAYGVLRYESGISAAPDGWHAIDIPGRHVIAAESHACPGCVVHEMGHLFLVEAEPEICPDEWPWFGWEVALARQAGCYQVWSRSSKSYIMGGSCEGRSWGTLKPHEKRGLIADRIAYAQALGIVSQDGKPLRSRNWNDPAPEVT
jgi:hypothetical protein